MAKIVIISQKTTMLQSYDELFDKIRNLNRDGVLKKHSPCEEECFWSFSCSGRESNPYGHFCPQDFKSCVSTYSTTRAEKVRKCKNFFPKCVKKFI